VTERGGERQHKEKRAGGGGLGKRERRSIPRISSQRGKDTNAPNRRQKKETGKDALRTAAVQGNLASLSEGINLRSCSGP